MDPSDYFDPDYFSDYFGGGGGGPPPPVPIQVGSGGNPFIVIAPMGMSWLNSGLNVNTLAIYPRRIYWNDPQVAGHVLQIEDGHGNILFKATAKGIHDSQYMIVTGGSKHTGGTRWKDFIVTTLDSGSLFMWIST